MATRRAEYQGATLRFDHGTSYLTHAQASGIADVMTPASTAGPNQDQSLRHLLRSGRAHSLESQLFRANRKLDICFGHQRSR
jgi:hypothetical protein